jgi:hypothetical protein
MKENWKSVVGYENLYQVSDLGDIRSIDRVVIQKDGKTNNLKGKLLKQQKGTNGYLFVCLSKNGVVKPLSVHRIVAIAFVGEAQNMQVNHINEVKTDNRAINLEWVTRTQNANHGTAIQRRVKSANFKGENNPMFGIKGADNKLSKPINQYDLNGVFIEKFDSAKTIERRFGYNSSSIAGVAKGRCKQAYEFIWKYANN